MEPAPKHHGIPAVFFLTHTAGNTRISLQEKLLTTSCETRTATDYSNIGSLVTSGITSSCPFLASQNSHLLDGEFLLDESRFPGT